MRERFDLGLEEGCIFHPEKWCAKPKRCYVHGPLLERPTRVRHLLHEGLHTQSWDSRPPKFHKTLCGKLLFRVIPDYIEIKDKFIRDYPGVEGHTKAMEWEWEVGFRYPPIPSDCPDYTVYYDVRWDRTEILVTNNDQSSCKACLGVRQREQAQEKRDRAKQNPGRNRDRSVHRAPPERIQGLAEHTEKTVGPKRRTGRPTARPKAR